MAGPRALTPGQVAQVTRALAQDKPWKRELQKQYRPIGTFAAREVRAEMRHSGDRRLAAAASAVRSAPGPTSVALKVGSASVPHALATVWGMHEGARTGYNLFSYTRPAPGTRVGIRALGESARPQHPVWVGADWVPAVRGQGPRGLNDAMADHADEIGDMFLAAGLAVVVRAFPSGSVT